MKAILASIAGLMLISGNSLAADPDYQKDIQPILTKNCGNCHGAKRGKGGLKLDSFTALMKGGRSGAAVLANKSGESPVFQSLGKGGDIRHMPPRGQLSKGDVELIKTWIDSGANGPKEKAKPAPAEKGTDPKKEDKDKSDKNSISRLDALPIGREVARESL